MATLNSHMLSCHFLAHLLYSLLLFLPPAPSNQHNSNVLPERRLRVSSRTHLCTDTPAGVTSQRRVCEQQKGHDAPPDLTPQLSFDIYRNFISWSFSDNKQKKRAEKFESLKQPLLLAANVRWTAKQRDLRDCRDRGGRRARGGGGIGGSGQLQKPAVRFTEI